MGSALCVRLSLVALIAILGGAIVVAVFDSYEPPPCLGVIAAFALAITLFGGISLSFLAPTEGAEDQADGPSLSPPLGRYPLVDAIRYFLASLLVGKHGDD
jgi:hypothetical protein